MRTFLVLLVATISASCLNLAKGLRLEIPEDLLLQFGKAGNDIIKPALDTFNEKVAGIPQTHWEEDTIKTEFRNCVELILETKDGKKHLEEKDIKYITDFFERVQSKHEYRSSYIQLTQHLTPIVAYRLRNLIDHIKTFGTNANMDAETIAAKIDDVTDEFAKTNREEDKFTEEELDAYLKKFYGKIDKDPWFAAKKGEECFENFKSATYKLTSTYRTWKEYKKMVFQTLIVALVLTFVPKLHPL